MPPFHSRSTGARRIADISSDGVRWSARTSSASCTWALSGIDFAVRGNTPPPSLISDVS
jgi:hypothetical protein